MKNRIQLYIDRLVHDQRKQVATMFNTIAALVLVQFAFKTTEPPLSFWKMLGGMISGTASCCLWYFAIKIVRKEEE